MSEVEAAIENRVAEWTVEAMSVSDLVHIVELERSTRLSVWGYDAYAAELTRPDAVMLIARRVEHEITSNTSIIGFAAARLNVDELHINNIAVHISYRGHGVGGALLVCALEQGKRLGARWAVLEVRAGNTAALRLYAKYNFGVLGRRPRYYTAPEEDALLMGISL